MAGLSVSEYVRSRVSGRQVVSRIEVKMLSELRCQGGFLKKIFDESHGMYSEERAIALGTLNTFIESLEEVVLNDSENSTRPR